MATDLSFGSENAKFHFSPDQKVPTPGSNSDSRATQKMILCLAPSWLFTRSLSLLADCFLNHFHFDQMVSLVKGFPKKGPNDSKQQ